MVEEAKNHMRSQIKKVGQTLVVSIGGKLDYETQEPFKQNLTKIARNTKTDSTPTNVIFNIEKLEFVGSSGIAQFIQTLKEFGNSTDTKTQICNASSEFKKVMKAFDEEEVFHFFDNEDQAGKQRDH